MKNWKMFMKAILYLWIFDLIYANNCGISPTLEKYEIYNPQNRVITGEYSKDGDWPWIVFILTKDDNGEPGGICTGTIIDKEWILTAAHCANGKNNVHVVLYGSVDITKAKKVLVKEKFIHPHFNQNITNDIALMKLLMPLKFDENVSSICLDKSVKTENGEIYVGAGFGNVMKKILTDDLEVNLNKPGTIKYQHDSHLFLRESPMANIGECELEIPEVSNRTICVGGVNTGPLRGDSGGPLMKIVNNKWVQIGITSLGSLSNIDPLSGRITAIYTDVNYYCDWIVETTNKNVSC
uniref:Peptidase S1 domain-containing protein n=1 Tax=Panagrolaimus sp. PS1159 TaxID=55785 RepID=A0AC35G7R9_9BILA